MTDMEDTGRPEVKQPYRVVGIGNDGERLIFGEGLDIIEAYELHRRLLTEKVTPLSSLSRIGRTSRRRFGDAGKPKSRQMDDRKKPGLAFWATLALVLALVGYPLSFGPACWLARRGIIWGTAVAHAYRPLIRGIGSRRTSIYRAAEWYGGPNRDSTWPPTMLEVLNLEIGLYDLKAKKREVD